MKIELGKGDAARVLAVLLMTPPEDLDGFRKRILGRESTLDTDKIGAVQKMLETMGLALFDEDPDPWARILAAHDALYDEDAAAGSPSTGVEVEEAGVAKPAKLGDMAAASGPMPVSAAPEPADPAPAPPRPAPPAPAPAPPAPAPAPPPPAPAPPPPAPAPVAVADAGNETMAAVDSGALKAALEAVPFKGKKAALPLAPKEAPNDAGETIAASQALPSDLLAIPFESKKKKAAKAKAAAAAAAAQAAPLPELTVQQYASMHAQIYVHPEREAAINAENQVPTADARARLDAMWQQRFGQDAALHAEFDRLYREYADWFRRQ